MSEAGSRRLWDWRFVISIAVLLAVAFIIYSSFTGQRDSARKSTQIASLVTQNAEDTRQFNVNQQHLLADEHVLLGYTAALATRQNAILDYLSRHGIHIPRHLLRPIAPPTLSPVEDGSTTPNSSGPPTPSSTPRPTSSPTPAPGGVVSPSPKVSAPTRGRAHQHPHPHPHPTPSGRSTTSSSP